VSAFLLDDTLLTCVVTEAVLLSVVAFKTLIGAVGSLVTVLLHISPDSDSEKSLKIGQYLMKLRLTMCASSFGLPCMQRRTDGKTPRI